MLVESHTNDSHVGAETGERLPGTCQLAIGQGIKHIHCRLIAKSFITTGHSKWQGIDATFNELEQSPSNHVQYYELKKHANLFFPRAGVGGSHKAPSPPLISLRLLAN